MSNLGPVGILRTAASDLMKRASWMNRGGKTFNGKRDINTALGYADTISPEEYRYRYQRNSIAARVVEALPFATWRGGGELVEDETPDTETKFEKAWKDLDARLHFWSIFQRADVLAGIGHYAIILIGAPGDLEAPLEKLKADDLIYLSPFSEVDACVVQVEEDATNPRCGFPTFYDVKRLGPVGQWQRRVHWTRTLHIADGVLDDAVYGTPRLERIWNLLDDLDKVTGGGAEAFWKRADQGMQIDIHPDVKLTPASEKAINDEVEEYVNGLKRILKTRGVDINTLGSDVANFTGPADGIISQISAGTGIPQRILMGSERGELASSQDKTNWDDRVADRREGFAAPSVVHQAVDHFVSLGVLPEPKTYNVRWPKIKDLNESQRADMAVKWTGFNTAMGDTVVTAAEVRDRVLGLDPFTEEQLKEIEAKKQEAAPLAAPEVVPTDPKKADVAPPVEDSKKPTVAVQHVLALAAQKGRQLLDTPELRTAIATNDRETLQRLLSAANSVIERELEETL